VRVLGRETRVYPDSAVFDTAVGRWVPATTDTVETWHVAERYGGVEIESWLDPDGRVVRATSPLGYTMERTAFEIAWNAYRAIESTGSASRVPDIIEGTAISSGATLPAVGTLGRLTVRLRNVDLSGFDLAGGRQEIHGDTLVVEREGAPLTAAYELPADSARWAAALAPTPLIQVNDPKIRARARQIVGDDRDPVRAARLLTDWVYRALDKRVTLSVPSARQVLEAGRGDCNEHTVLYVALARAVGLPTRTATGLVHVRGRFYFHAWPEVWLGRWVAVDPTLGQFPADASHLRFVIGGLARQVELVRLIGSLQVDVLDAEGP
jgi:transglutaminase-like putative cysteine protease